MLVLAVYVHSQVKCFMFWYRETTRGEAWLSAEVKPGLFCCKRLCTGGLPQIFLSPVFCDTVTVTAHRLKKIGINFEFIFKGYTVYTLISVNLFLENVWKYFSVKMLNKQQFMSWQDVIIVWKETKASGCLVEKQFKNTWWVLQNDEK